MFYTTLSEDGFCYIPTVAVVDEVNIEDYNGELITLIQPITRLTVAQLIGMHKTVMIKHETFEDAEALAREIYKKMPRHRRQLGYCTDEDGAGEWESEVADKYL